MIRLLMAGALLVSLAGCVSAPVLNDGPPKRSKPVPNANQQPTAEARSRYGNPAFYEVFGQRYYVMDSAAGYRERGIASWYGKKFHGRKTSSGEPYNMHAFSAAHKTLPLPTWVRVTNLKNGRSLNVRVNDRGPFVDNRIIDLSYAAAEALDLIESGTGMVEVEVIDVHNSESPATRARDDTSPLFIQAGAFSQQGNAQRRLNALRESGIDNAFVSQAGSDRDPIWRVHIGPVADVSLFDALVKRLTSLGINDARLVSTSE